MARARVFQPGNSQAVRLPKAFRFAAREVEIFRRGDEVVLRERPGSLAARLARLPHLPADFPDDIPDGPVDPAVRESIAFLCDTLSIATVPTEAANHYARLRAAMRSRGTPVGNNDRWLATHAIAADLVMVTSNEKEFRRLSGLRVQNWSR